MVRRAGLFVCFSLAALSLSGCAPSEADRKMLQDGFSQYSSRQFDAAETAATTYLQKNPAAPNLDEAFYLRGLARYAKGERAAAADDLTMALAKSQRADLKAKAYGVLGDIAFDESHWQPAIDSYQKSLTFQPERPAEAHARFRIGECLQCLGQWDAAVAYFQRVVSLDTDRELSGRALSRMSLHHFSLQFGAFRQAANAGELIRDLKAAGIAAAAATEMRDGQLIYLVRAGSYPLWQDADAARARLLAKYPLVSIVP